MTGYDVIVIGGGNAGFSAAHAAAERQRRVLLLERGERDMAGGNSFYTAGATRITHNGLEDLQSFIVHDDRHATTEVPPYTSDDFRSDMEKVTEGANDPALTEVLVAEARPTVEWLSGKGLPYRLMYERQAYERTDGTYLFWGGLHVGNVGGGEGMIADHTRVAEESGVEIRYGTGVDDFMVANGRVVGVRLEDGSEVRAESVIVASGGFEANAELRERELGAGWANAKVRGTPYNDGRLLEAGLRLGAQRAGDWSSCHSTQWDALNPDNESNRELTHRLTRQSYPLGILVNRDGKRFLDEGSDFRNYTYAKYGREILAQPGSIAYQIFDGTLRKMLRTEEYDMPGISVEAAPTLRELAEKIDVDPDTFEATVQEFNESIDRTRTFDPTVKDGRAAAMTPPKSNWSHEITQGPFYAYPVTCGITFTFGGLKADTHGRVLDADDNHIQGLFVCGEALGGLFSKNYPGGTGLAAGMVFGRRAGSIA